MLNPPIPHVGGKSKLRKTIIEMIPEHTCYVELFFGAGWVYFEKEPSYVENLSFEKIIKKYDRPHTFFFCDPPYFETCGYENKFIEENHIKLRDLLKDIKGKFLLTLNDHEKVREWYKDFNLDEVEVGYSLCKDKTERGKYK